MPENDLNSKKDMESVLLLKQKIYKTHDLIMQYSKKTKENNRMKSDLTTAKKEAKRVICNYKSAMDKITELELRITQGKQINEKLTNQMNESEVNINANKQIIQQLTCKMEELEEKHSVKIMEYDLLNSSLEEKIKVLEQELKKSELKLKRSKKKTAAIDTNTTKCDTETNSTSDIGINVSLCDDVLNFQPITQMQDKSIMTDDSSLMNAESTLNIGIKSTLDIGVNTSLCELNLRLRCETQDKNVMTDECYRTANDPFPLFCAKCETYLPLDLIPEKIYKTMSIYPELIKGDLTSPRKKRSLIACSPLHDSYPDFTNKEIAPTEISSILHLNTSDKCNNSIAVGQTAYCTMQNSRNVKSRDTNVAAVMTNSSNDLNFTTIDSSKNIDCTRENIPSDNVLIKQSSSIKKIEKKLKLLENKLKDFPKLKKKRNINSCHYCKHSDGISLNKDILTTICKSIALCYSERKEKNLCFRNEQNESRSHKRSTKTRQKIKQRNRLKKCNLHKNAFLWEVECLDDTFSQKMSCENDAAGDAAKVINISQFEHDKLQTTIQDLDNDNSDINTSDQLHYNESDKESISSPKENQENVSHLTEVMSMKDNSVISDLISNEISIKNNSSQDDDAKCIDLDNQISTEMSQSSQNSLDHTNNKIIRIKTQINRESKFKQNVTNRLLKKIKNLKRKSQAIVYMNKQKPNQSCSDYEPDNLTNLEIEGQTSSYTYNTVKNISNLKRKVDCILNIQNTTESNSDYYNPVKKTRIAHIPNLNISQKGLTHIKTASVVGTFQRELNENQLGQIEEKDLSIESKKHTVKNKSKENIKNNKLYDNEPREESSTSNGDHNNDGDISLSDMDGKQASTIIEFDQCDKVTMDDNTSTKAPIERIITETSNSRDVSYKDVSYNTTINLECEGCDESNTNPQIESPSSPCEDSNDECDEDVGEDIQMKKITEITEEITSIGELEHISDKKAEENDDDCAIPEDASLNNDILSLSDRSLEVSFCESYNNDDNISNVTSNFCQLPTSRNNEVIKDCDVKLSKKKIRANQQGKATKCIDVSYNDIEESPTLISWVIKYVKQKSTERQEKLPKEIRYISSVTDKFVKKQLKKLADSAWEDAVYDEVKQNLTNIRGPRIIAKCIIEFLSENIHVNNILDKSFTPPAPLMTTFEQKLTALLIDLEVTTPMVIHFVQVGIQYKLFKLKNDVKNLSEIDTLTRMYVVLSRIQKDREKIRIMCCDALYCMGLKSISLLYIVLTCWPEVLPNAEVNIGILPRCIAFLIGWREVDNNRKISSSRLQGLKSLITAFYNYVYSRETLNDFVKELSINLKAKQTDGLNTAVILIAKKIGPSLAYENIISSTLLPMIINHESPCIYNGFSLLGKLLRTFPPGNKHVQDIIEQLHDLIESGQGSHNQQEGIISALLSLSRKNVNVVASSVLKWTPNVSLRSTTIMQLEAFIKMRTIGFWKYYLKQNLVNPI